MPRQPDASRLLAALTAQRTALRLPPWSGPQTAAALGDATARAVLDAIGRGAEPQPEALAAAVRHTLVLLAAQAPGRAVEVRVPPYGAAQCVAGQRHTRGTPPNVVEADPVTWMLLAAGRLAWAEAVRDGRASASGPRSDLSGYLPLLAPDQQP
jgi:Bacterial SCP ortholog